MDTPNVVITGTSGSGKSALAYAIKQALESHGINVAIVGDEDELQGTIVETWKERLGCLKGEVVIVETKQVG